MKKLFACALYAETPFLSTKGQELQTVVSAAAIAASNASEAEVILLAKLKRDLPATAGWRGHYVSVLEIPKSLINQEERNG